MNDYRITSFCGGFSEIREKKQQLVSNHIRKDHPKSKETYKFISCNHGRYKQLFIEIYNCKCSYCGVSMDVICNKEGYEIDHFIPEDYFSSKQDADYIDNLVLACFSCNRKKGRFLITGNCIELLNPDKKYIGEIFIRNELFYIEISENYKENEDIIGFYTQLNLGSELRRIDYLLMYVIKTFEKMNNPEIKNAVYEIIKKLRQYRNNVY